MRESKIERYFVQQVALHGGTTRKPRWFAAPDRLTIWPPDRWLCPTLDFIELKAPSGRVRIRQEREHERLRAAGCRVFVLYSKAQVDAYITKLRSER